MRFQNGNALQENANSSPYPITIGETRVTVIRPQNGLLAFGSVLLNVGPFRFFLGNVALKRKMDGGIKLQFPSEFVKDKEHPSHFPANHATHQLLHEALVACYKEQTKDFERYRSEDEELQTES